MNIPIESIIGILVAAFGFVIGALWGHHGAIKDRVRYSDCTRKRESCPCVSELDNLKKRGLL